MAVFQCRFEISTPKDKHERWSSSTRISPKVSLSMENIAGRQKHAICCSRNIINFLQSASQFISLGVAQQHFWHFFLSFLVPARTDKTLNSFETKHNHGAQNVCRMQINAIWTNSCEFILFEFQFHLKIRNYKFDKCFKAWIRYFHSCLSLVFHLCVSLCTIFVHIVLCLVQQRTFCHSCDFKIFKSVFNLFIARLVPSPERSKRMQENSLIWQWQCDILCPARQICITHSTTPPHLYHHRFRHICLRTSEYHDEQKWHVWSVFRILLFCRVENVSSLPVINWWWCTLTCAIFLPPANSTHIRHTHDCRFFGF